MKKPDVKKLEEKIDAMKTICKDGRKEIKDILSVALGVEFKSSKRIFHPGVVWIVDQIPLLILNASGFGLGRDESDNLLAMRLDYFTGWHRFKTTDSCEKYTWKFLASSLEEYYADK